MVKAADGIFSQEATQMLNYAQNIETAKNALVAHSYYQSALDLFEFDSWQALPKNGRAFRGSTAAFMSEQAGALLRTPQIRRTADFFRTLSIRDPSVYASPLDFAIARRFVRLSDRAARVPAALDAAFVEMALRNQQIWREARAAADFELYKPYMKELFAECGDNCYIELPAQADNSISAPPRRSRFYKDFRPGGVLCRS